MGLVSLLGSIANGGVLCAVKWEFIEPEPDVFDFGPADEIVSFAQSVGAKVRGHNFMW